MLYSSSTQKKEKSWLRYCAYVILTCPKQTLWNTENNIAHSSKFQEMLALLLRGNE